MLKIGQIYKLKVQSSFRMVGGVYALSKRFEPGTIFLVVDYNQDETFHHHDVLVVGSKYSYDILVNGYIEKFIYDFVERIDYEN